MEETYSFGEWIKRRRQDMRLTQRELAAAAFCSTAMVKKIEADERRPSPELAEALAEALKIPAEQRGLFVQSARGERPLAHFSRRFEASREPERAALYGARTISLPAARSPFVGRKLELEEITDKLMDGNCRLLTLLGPGGIGKTRLALEAARRLAERFADGVAFIDLTAVSDPAYLAEAIAQALNVTIPSPAADHLPRLLHRRRMLMVLDNCEHLAGAEGEGMVWLSSLLLAVPGLTLLATSRERLQLVEEWVFMVPGLDAAVELFIQTAVRVKPDFDAAGNLATIRGICDLVGRMPLAVELAASWVPFMSCDAVAQHIAEDIDILATTVRNIPARHRSMRAVFDQSWAMLSKPEQEALRHLSVFCGGWAAEEAHAVASADLLTLRGLVEKSLVQIVDDQRFDLHELVRQYAAEKLADSAEEQAVRRRHYEVFLDLAAELDVQQHGAQGLAALRRYGQERENIQSALAWSLDQQESELTLRLLAYLWFYWFDRGQNREGERWTRPAIEKAGDADSLLLCTALIYLADYVALQGRFAEANRMHPRAVGMAERLGDPEARIMVLIGYVQSSDQVEPALAYLREMIGIIEESGKLTYLLPRFTDMYGRWLQSAGRYEEAEARFQESLALYRQMGNVTTIASPLAGLGQLALLAGEIETAYGYILEGVTAAREAGIDSGAGLQILASFGLVQLYRGEVEAAEASLLEALQMAEELDAPVRKQQILSYASEVALAQQDVASAEAYLQDSLVLVATFYQRMREMDHLEGQVQALFFDLIAICRRAALVDAARGQHERAVTLASAAASLGIDSERTDAHPLQARVEQVLQQVRSQLGDNLFTRAWQKGKALSLDEVFQFLLQEG